MEEKSQQPLDHNPEYSSKAASGDITPLFHPSSLQRCKTAFFCYSPSKRVLLSWSDNLEQVVGTSLSNIAKDGNLFLRHVHPEDRFSLMADLEAALAGKCAYQKSYRWTHPHTGELRLLHCRGSLNARKDRDVFEGIILDLTGAMYNEALSPSPFTNGEVLAALHEPTIVLNDSLQIIETNWELSRQDSDSPARWCNFGDPNLKSSLIKPGSSFPGVFACREVRARIVQQCKNLLDEKITRASEEFALEGKTATILYSRISRQSTAPGVLIALRDRTELSTLEHHYLALSESDSVRKQVFGLAHNLNTTLQLVLGQALTIRERSEDAEVCLYASDQIVSSVERAAALTRPLFALHTNQKRVDLNQLLLTSLTRFSTTDPAHRAQPTVVYGTPPLLSHEADLLKQFLDELFLIIAQIFERCSGSVQCAIHTGEARKTPTPIPAAGPFAFCSLVFTDSHTHSTRIIDNDLLANLTEMVSALEGCVTANTSSSRSTELLIHIPAN
jgi:hypothetical protein